MRLIKITKIIGPKSDYEGIIVGVVGMARWGCVLLSPIESGIPIGTLQRWYHPRSEVKNDPTQPPGIAEESVKQITQTKGGWLPG
jgi:hypothetical protein